jgi:hypothetical protein
MSTQIQAAVTGALEELGLENESDGPPGSPSKLVVTKETVAAVTALMGKTLFIGADGQINENNEDSEA